MLQYIRKLHQVGCAVAMRSSPCASQFLRAGLSSKGAQGVRGFLIDVHMNFKMKHLLKCLRLTWISRNYTSMAEEPRSGFFAITEHSIRS